MTTKLEQAARQALEALESCNVGNWSMAFDEFAVVEAITALREALQEHALQTLSDIHQQIEQPQENTARCGGCNKTAKDGWALYCVECWEKTQPQDTECPCGSECEKCSARCLPQESFSDCIWYTYIDFNEKPPYFRYDTGDNTAKENESTYYEIQEELKQFGYTIEDVYIDHDTICGDIVSINKALAQPQGCPHRIADARNPIVKSGYICVDCGALFSAADHTIQPVVPQGDPVYYQWRRKNQPWSIRHVYHNKVEATTDDSEVRELYTTPPSIEAAIEAEREACAKVCDDLHHWAASCCAKDIRARGEK